MMITWIDVLNTLLCGLIGWASLCRLNMLNRHVDWRPRAMFTLLVLGSTAHGLGPWMFRESAGIGDTVFSATVLVGLLLSSHRWRGGAPTGLTAPAEFDAVVRTGARR